MIWHLWKHTESYNIMNNSREAEWVGMHEVNTELLERRQGGRAAGHSVTWEGWALGRMKLGAGTEKGKNRQEQPLQGGSGIRYKLCYLTVSPGPPVLHSSQGFLQKMGMWKSTIVSEIKILGSHLSLGMCSLDFTTPTPWPQEAGFQDFISSPYRGQEVHLTETVIQSESNLLTSGIMQKQNRVKSQSQQSWWESQARIQEDSGTLTSRPSATTAH